MIYRPGDMFSQKVTLKENGVSVVATVEKNGSVVSGTGISSSVVGKICQINLQIPDSWLSGDLISIILTATLDDMESNAVIEFRLESKNISELVSQEDMTSIGTIAKQDEILSKISDVIIPTEIFEKIEFIYDKFYDIPEGVPAIVLPGPSVEGMTTLYVILRDGPVLINGVRVSLEMCETSNVYMDGAYEVDKEQNKYTGDYIDGNNVTHHGVAVFQVFSSTKLKESGYNGLYRVKSRGLNRTVWVPDEGGELGQLLTQEP